MTVDRLGALEAAPDQGAFERARVCLWPHLFALVDGAIYDAVLEDVAAAITAAAAEARAAERERLGFGKIVMMSEQRNRPGQPPRWCALARGSEVAAMGDTEEEARLRALATPAQSKGK